MKYSALDIKRIRISMKLTQAEFGKILGVGLRSIQNWESGAREISETAKLLLENTLKRENITLECALEKDGVSFTDFEVIDWLVKNKTRLKQHNEFFKLWLASEINAKVDEELSKLGVTVEYKTNNNEQ